MAENQAQDGQERNEAPTQRRLDEARRKGQVPRSRELATSALLVATAIGLMTLGPRVAASLAGLMRHNFAWRAPAPGAEPDLPRVMLEAMADALLALAPFLLLSAIVALAAPILVGGLGWSGENLAFKPNRLDPLKGIGRMFSLRALMELAKALAKFAIVSSVAVSLIWWRLPEMLATRDEALFQSAAHAAWLIASGFLIVCASTILIAAVDVPFQIWNHVRGLRMSRQDVKDEMRDTEGKPEVRGRIRQLQRELARGRMLEEVPRADVVVTNPTHFSVALRWDQATMSAPTVVASGAGAVAARIREVAREAKVPLVEAPALTRAIYWSTEVGAEIPAGLYTAVAAILAWLYRLRDPRFQDEPPPPPPVDLPIPEALRR